MLLMGLWPSPVKKWIYRLAGYRIGRGVRIGVGAVVCGDNVEIGDYARIGFGSSIRGKTIRIGPHVQIGAMTMMDTPYIEIGEGTKINEQVFVGGLQFPDSRLVIGKNCQIMQMTFINPSRSITIGDDTGIGGDCLLFGHASWLSRFEGYPVDFDSIHIGNSVSLAWRVFVLPGTRIADGAVIGANSLVKGTIPPRCLAVGFPARVVAREPYFPRRIEDTEKRALLAEILDEFVQFLLAGGFHCGRNGNCIEVVSDPRGWFRARRNAWRMQIETEVMTEHFSALQDQVNVLLSLREIPTSVRMYLSTRQIAWVDIERKERSACENDLAEEVIQHLKRHGVRLLRSTHEPHKPP
jgi:acetyltransferase-like isoleucine patch superfamily enzyme